MNITWVLEREVFNDNHDRLSNAAASSGHKVISWDDLWWENGKWALLKDEYAIFHGSLGNADKIGAELSWKPGVFCNTSAFDCHSWYEKAKAWLLHEKWFFTNVAEFLSEPESYLSDICSPPSFFVRPDSCLKPFSGRVIQREELSLEALDYGFYYDDEKLPIVITPVVGVGTEWRFIIAEQNPVASSAYKASNRSETKCDCPSEVANFAKEVAAGLIPPDSVYVIDICKCAGTIKLLEINPFSGADLYACDREAIVSAVEKLFKTSVGQQTS